MSDTVKFDKTTSDWFRNHSTQETTVTECERCGLFYKPVLGHKCKMAPRHRDYPPKNEPRYIEARRAIGMALDSNLYDTDQKEAITDAIERTPTADVRKFVCGIWLHIPEESDLGYNTFRCSECGEKDVVYENESKGNFCSNCGAYMKSDGR